MRKIALLTSLLFIAAGAYSQELTHVTFSGGATLSFFSFRTDQDIILRISGDGKVQEWGTDPGPGRYYYDPRKLQPYLGRVEYFGQEYDSVFRGKVKSIGTCTFTYYDKYETASKIGKLKTIGRIPVDYYDNYEDAAYKGKIKFANNISISYYSTFDEKASIGKLKSIGSFEYIWFPSYDRYRGGLKSGPITRVINNITYTIM